MSSPQSSTCLFEHNRDPSIIFDIPTRYVEFAEKIGLDLKDTYGILLPNSRFWIEVSLVFILVLILGMVVSVIVYYTVLQRTTTTKQQQRSHTTNTTTANLITFGAIVPFCFLFPYAFISVTNIQNVAQRFILCCPIVVYAFRSVEALFGFSPPAVTVSLRKFVTYYATPAECMYNEDEKRFLMATSQDFKRSLFSFIQTIIMISFSFSLLSHHGYEPFESKNAAGEGALMTMKDYVNLMHLGNCFILAIMFHLMLLFIGGTFSLVIPLATGIKIIDLMHNPLFESTSPSDFWGRRWNMTAHKMLKRAVFMPIRRYSSTFVASLGVFIASGLFHEYLVHVVMIYKRDPKVMYTSSSCPAKVLEHEVQLGTNMAFFAWNGILVVIERLLKKHPMAKSIGLALPPYVVPFFIVLMALPVAHWFSNPYVRGGYFYDLQVGFPVIIKVAQEI
uniref:Wax synthase domain-containing protein n=1 Tax=Ditylum brightwellii TaxID=49249 RepID=A0A6U3RJD3_9STRA|mmetsp:Transcript_26594/g.39453  ORF Transcript_26594/g.39453 Transcript_26594/m.39453 type:complete len:448 (+) Transcript_26594:143-1486(+)